MVCKLWEASPAYKRTKAGQHIHTTQTFVPIWLVSKSGACNGSIVFQVDRVDNEPVSEVVWGRTHDVSGAYTRVIQFNRLGRLLTDCDIVKLPSIVQPLGTMFHHDRPGGRSLRMAVSALISNS